MVQQGVPQVHAHELRPENGHRAFERKAHVTAEVTRRICDLVHHAEFALAVFVKLNFFCHLISRFHKYCRFTLTIIP